MLVSLVILDRLVSLADNRSALPTDDGHAAGLAGRARGEGARAGSERRAAPAGGAAAVPAGAAAEAAAAAAPPAALRAVRDAWSERLHRQQQLGAGAFCQTAGVSAVQLSTGPICSPYSIR